jgi:hypothetical protein
MRVGDEFSRGKLIASAEPTITAQNKISCHVTSYPLLDITLGHELMILFSKIRTTAFLGQKY